MVSIDTFLSVGKTGGLLLGPPGRRPDDAFQAHLRSIVVKARVGPGRRRAGGEFVRSPRH